MAGSQLVVPCRREMGAYEAHTLDAAHRLRSVFWMTQVQRELFSRYSDVLIMDVTHRTNRFNLPFCAVAGVDGNNRTVLMAQALLRDETAASFEFVLHHLMQACPHASIRTIFTDADAAETAAIRKLLPGVVHFRCGWHLNRDVAEFAKCLGGEKLAFVHDFAQCQRARSPTDFQQRWAEFDAKWRERSEAVARYLDHLYADRGRWAAYVQRHSFTLGIASTQRVEGLFGKCKRAVDHHSTLCGLLEETSRLAEAQHDSMTLDFVESEFRVRQSATAMSPLTTHFQSLMQMVQTSCSPFVQRQLEVHLECAPVYYVQQLDHATGQSDDETDPPADDERDADPRNTTTELISRVQRVLGGQTFTYKVFNNARRTEHVVVFHPEQSAHVCTCLYGVQRGIPCRHMMAVSFASRFPITLAMIHPRWLRAPQRGARVRGAGLYLMAPYKDMERVVLSSLDAMQPRLEPGEVGLAEKRSRGQTDEWATKRALADVLSEATEQLMELEPFINQLGFLVVANELQNSMSDLKQRLQILLVSPSATLRCVFRWLTTGGVATERIDKRWR